MKKLFTVLFFVLFHVIPGYAFYTYTYVSGNAGSLSSWGTPTGSGTSGFAGNTFNISGTLTVSFTTAITTADAGTIFNFGDGTHTATVNISATINSGTVNILAGSVLNYSASPSFGPALGVLSPTSTFGFMYTGGTSYFKAAAYGNVNLATTGTNQVSCTGHTVTINGILTQTSGGGINTGTVGSAIIFTKGQTLSKSMFNGGQAGGLGIACGTGNAITLDNTFTSPTFSSITLTSGSLILNTSVNLSGTPVVTSGSIATGTNSVSFATTADFTISSGMFAGNTGNIIAAGTKNVITDSSLSFTIPNSFSNTGSGNLIIGSGSTVNMGGSITRSGTGIIDVATNSGATITFNGTASQAIPAGIFGGNNINKLTINNAAGVSIANSSTLNILQTLNLTAGKLTLGTSAPSNAILNIEGTGTPITGSGTMDAYTYQPTISFSGSGAAQTMPASATFVSNHNIYNLTINNSSGVTAGNGYLDIYGTLTLSSGIFTLNGGGLYFYGSTGSPVTGVSLSNYINPSSQVVGLLGTVAQTLPNNTFLNNTVNSFSLKNTANSGTYNGPLTVSSALTFDSPGTLNINGNFILANNGTINVEVGGTTVGTQYDQLNVSGTASIGTATTLNISSINSFSPAAGNTFTFVQTSGAITGSFVTVNQPSGISGTVTYPSGSSLLYSITPPPVVNTQLFYFQPSTGDANVLTNWNTDPSGNGVAPASLTADKQAFTINNGKQATITAAFGGSKVFINVGDEGGGDFPTRTSGTLITAGSSNLNAIINVNKASALYYNQINTVTHPVLGILEPTSTVIYNGSTAQNVLAGNYGNVTVNNAGGLTLSAPIAVSGTITKTSGAINANTKAISLNGTATQTLPDDSIFVSGAYDIIVDNDSGVSLTAGHTLTVTDSVLIKSGVLTVNSGANLIINGGSRVVSPVVVDSTYKSGYTLVWHDEFSGAAHTAPDASKWVHHSPVTVNTTTLHGYTFQWASIAQNSYLDGNGHLLIAVKDSSDGKFYCGDIATQNAAQYLKQYGYMECKMMFTPNDGVNSAFWLQATSESLNPAANNPGVYGAEIDVCEYTGPYNSAYPSDPNGKVNSTIHKNGYGTYHQSSTHAVTVSNSGWHILGLEWTPTAYNFYLDGVLTYTISNSTSGGPWVSNRSEFLLLSAGLGWGMAPNDPAGGNTWPALTKYDYVRVYQKN